MARAFFDKDPIANLQNSVLYHAAGLVQSCHMHNDTPSLSGKDYCVTFIDPWGELITAWRAKSEIIIYEVDDASAAMLTAAYNAVSEKM